MYSKKLIIATAAILVVASSLMVMARSAFAACDPGERIDKSTAATAKKKIEAAGYRQPHGFKKGCDNFWHAEVIKDGVPLRVVLSPQGDVIQEKD